MRAALVTGSSEGIGLALASALCARGYAVTLSARSRDRLEEVAHELREAGGEVETIVGDLAQPDVVRAAVDAHRTRFGRLDVLVNNVGTGIGEPIGELSLKRLDLQLHLNVRTAIVFTREAIGMLLTAAAEHRQAWVVNVCSRAAVAPQPWLSVYSASKAALLAFSQSTNAEFAERGVRSCAICPGTVATALTRATPGMDPDRLVTPEDIASVMRLLLDLSPACELTQVVIDTRYDHSWQPPG